MKVSLIKHPTSDTPADNDSNVAPKACCVRIRVAACERRRYACTSSEDGGSNEGHSENDPSVLVKLHGYRRRLVAVGAGRKRWLNAIQKAIGSYDRRRPLGSRKDFRCWFIVDCRPSTSPDERHRNRQLLSKSCTAHYLIILKYYT